MNLLEFEHTIKTLTNIVSAGGDIEAIYKHLRRARINVTREQASRVHQELTEKAQLSKLEPDSYIISDI